MGQKLSNEEVTSLVQKELPQVDIGHFFEVPLENFFLTQVLKEKTNIQSQMIFFMSSFCAKLSSKLFRSLISLPFVISICELNKPNYEKLEEIQNKNINEESEFEQVVIRVVLKQHSVPLSDSYLIPKIFEPSKQKIIEKETLSELSLRDYLQELKESRIIDKESKHFSQTNRFPSNVNLDVSQISQTMEMNSETSSYNFTLSLEFLMYIIKIFQLDSNLDKVIKIIESDTAFFLLFPHYPFTLEDLLAFSYQTIHSDGEKFFLLYQILRGLTHAHRNGIIHGNLSPSSIFLTEKMWVTVSQFYCPSSIVPSNKEEENVLSNVIQLWQSGKLSNFDYLLYLNSLVKRRSKDPHYHPIMPWVMDFSEEKGGWRDLTKSKYRLTKGDEQLDFTYSSSSDPHHITEPLSDLTYYHYVARRTPIPVLKYYVRSKYEPNEYPSSIQRLYNWTPDECIPEFFSDPTIFTSIHSDMPNLSLPLWASSPEDFINKHRAALESEIVSKNLHHWIDLNFGYQLSGSAAEEAKNVALLGKTRPKNRGFVQLFYLPHPQRYSQNAEDSNQLYEYESLTNFTLHIRSSDYRKPISSTISSFESLQSFDMFSLGCITFELFTGKSLFSPSSMRTYFEFRVLPPHFYEISPTLRPFILSLISLEASITNDPLLESHLFPEYFADIHSFLSIYHSTQILSEKLDITFHHLSKLLATPEEGFELVLPYLISFFSVQEIQTQSLILFDPLGAKLGAYQSKKILLQPILKLYQVQGNFDLCKALLEMKFIRSLINRLGQNCFIDSILPYLLERVKDREARISSLATDVVVHVSGLIGEVMTIKYIVKVLIPQLAKSLEESIVHVLIAIASQLGESIITRHYIPVLSSLLLKYSSPQFIQEGSLLSILKLLRGIIEILSGKLILEHFIIQSNHFITLLLNSPFKDEIMLHVAHCILLICFKIGVASCLKFIVPHLKFFFQNYSFYYLESGFPKNKDSEQVKLFSPHLVFILYYRLLPLLGSKLKETLPNHKLLDTIIEKHPNLNDELKWIRIPRLDKFSITNSLELNGREKESVWTDDIPNDRDNLSKIWIFSGYEIFSYKAHIDSIKSISVLPSESLFITASRDTTVKIWDVDNGSCKGTYSNHTTPVKVCTFLPSRNLIASSDNNIHVWDPETKNKIFHIEGESNNPVTCFEVTKDDRLLISLSSESTLNFIDLDNGKSCYEWSLPNVMLSTQFTALAISYDKTWIAVGSKNGDIALFDQRTGILQDYWKAHDAPIKKLKPFETQYLISTSKKDKTLQIWNIKVSPPCLMKKIKRVGESIDSFSFYQKMMFVAVGNKIGIVELDFSVQGETIQISSESLIRFKTSPFMSNFKNSANKIETAKREVVEFFGESKVTTKAMEVLHHHQTVLMGTVDGYIKICQ